MVGGAGLELLITVTGFERLSQPSLPLLFMAIYLPDCFTGKVGLVPMELVEANSLIQYIPVSTVLYKTTLSPSQIFNGE